jgi:serine/threonine protein kinase
MSLQPGRQVRHYIIEGLIAKGGMGVVWQARDLVHNESVAIKAVANDLVQDPRFKIRIQDEARRHKRLEHPNIVPVLDVFDTAGEICIVMKLIEGTSLDKLLKSKVQNRLEIHEAIPIVRDILKALDYAHQHGIVHRDVKPSNVLLDKDNRALLIDFGIALAMGEERRTRTGQIVGTAMYMSPEQITKPKTLDHRSDVYSAGCVFYEMLAGRPPFISGRDGVGDTDFEIQHAHVSINPASPKTRVPSIPADLDRLVMAALQKDPNVRIPGCLEFLRLLEQVSTFPGREEKDAAVRVKGKRSFHLSLIIIGLALVLWFALLWLFRH